MAPLLHSALVDHMAENPFSIVNDCSNDCGLSKMNLVCVHIFDVQRSKQVKMKFFSMCSTSGEGCSKSKTLFDVINNALRNDGLDWENVVSVGLDNIYTNMGDHNSLKSHAHTENPEALFAGCKCHLANCL